MIRIMMVGVLGCLLLASTAFAAEMKIGVADMQVVGAQSDANKKAREKYEAEFNSEASQLTKQKQAFEQKVSTFMAQRATMAQKTVEERGVSLSREEQQIREKEMKFQQRVSAIQNSIAQELAVLAIDAAAEVAKEKGLDVILSQSSILFAGEKLDVTNDVLTAVNKTWKDKGSKMLGAEADAATSGKASEKADKPATKQETKPQAPNKK